MPVEKSAGAVIFRKENSKIYYLLLHYQMGHWGFPKGIIEKGETLKKAAQREIQEETGIKELKFLEGFKKEIKYFFKLKNKTIFKIATFLLAETKEKKVKLSFEHKDFKWLPFEEALEQITHKNTQEILKKANSFLKDYG